MARSRTVKRWDHPRYKYAYVCEYRGIACTVVQGGPRLSTGLLFVKENRDKAMQILTERYEAYERTGLKTKPVVVRHGEDEVSTCGELFEQFRAVRSDKLSDNAYYLYLHYFQNVPAHLPLTSTVAIGNAVRNALSAKYENPNTLNAAYNRIRGVFAFGIERGWLRVNPIHSDMVPAAFVKGANPYTHEQLLRALGNLTRERDRAFIMFLMGSAARPVEVPRLAWDGDVFDTHYILTSYKSGKNKVVKRRIMPNDLTVWARIAIEMARRGKWGATKVFGVAGYHGVAERFNIAMGGEGRGLYPIRQYAINAWRDLGWPEPVRNTLAGHEAEIAREVYETDLTPAQLVKAALGIR